MEFSRQGYWRMGSHSFSRGSFWPRDWTWLSCLADRFFSIWASRNRISWCLQLCRPAPLPSIYSLLQVRSQPLQRWKLQALSVCHPRSVIWFLVWVLHLSDSEPAEAGQGITTLTHTLTHHHTPFHTHTHTHTPSHTHTPHPRLQTRGSSLMKSCLQAGRCWRGQGPGNTGCAGLVLINRYCLQILWTESSSLRGWGLK